MTLRLRSLLCLHCVNAVPDLGNAVCDEISAALGEYGAGLVGGIELGGHVKVFLCFLQFRLRLLVAGRRASLHVIVHSLVENGGGLKLRVAQLVPKAKYVEDAHWLFNVDYTDRVKASCHDFVGAAGLLQKLVCALRAHYP